jgi:hypothetical protein
LSEASTAMPPGSEIVLGLNPASAKPVDGESAAPELESSETVLLLFVTHTLPALSIAILGLVIPHQPHPSIPHP